MRALNYPDDPDVGDSLFWIDHGSSGVPTLSRPRSDFTVNTPPPFAASRHPRPMGLDGRERWPACESEMRRDAREREEWAISFVRALRYGCEARRRDVEASTVGTPRSPFGLRPGQTQGAYREGPREVAGYAYRGTIVGEASHPGPIDCRPSQCVRATAARTGLCPSGSAGWREAPILGRLIRLARVRACRGGRGRVPVRARKTRRSAHTGGDSADNGADDVPPRHRAARTRCRHRVGPRETARYGYRGSS